MNQLVSIWIDALDFTNKGGWKEDSQFVHLMGSAYLIAADKPGEPVEDAKISVNIPKSGRYRVWVRDRNWLRPHDPGVFSLLVNGEDKGVVLGKQPSDAWLWEVAGDYTLPAGETEVTVRDLSGYFARFSSILITEDFDFVPSREISKMHQQRAMIKGYPIEIRDGGSYDVIVAGGGPGGVPAAIASARSGAKTLLLQDRPMLGGNGSTEVGITFDGASVAHINARETGIAEEIRRLRDRETTTVGDWTRALEQLVAAEKNLTVIYHQHVCAADVQEDSTIASVVALNICQLTKSRYTGKIFIDCTGDGWLGYHAGAKYRFGRESEEQHGENLAPKVADMLTMSGCLKSGNRPYFEKADVPIAYHAPDWVTKLPEDDLEFGRVIPGDGSYLMWWLEAPNTYDDMWDGEQTRDALLMLLLGYYDHIKNHWSDKEKTEKLQLRIVSVFNGRRESRRLIGDYVLTQEDCKNSRDFEDAISYSGWSIDVHHPDGIFSGKEGALYCIKHVPQIKIPYRCLYSKNIGNLLFAGRNVSATHIAMGTLRVQNTVATLGQAAGTAAGLCVKHGVNPRAIYTDHLFELQQTLLKNDQYIPGIKNMLEDDPCLTATATATSVCTTEIYTPLKGKDGALRPLDKTLGAVITFNNKEGDVDGLWLKLHNATEQPQTVTIHAHTEGSCVSDFVEVGEEAVARAEVPPMGEHWVLFPLQMKLEQDEFMDKSIVRLWADPAEGVSWREVTDLSFSWKAGWKDPQGRWVMYGDRSYRFNRTKPEEVLANCAPENVINGYSRILDAERYEWVSDSAQKLPQSIELTFRQPAVIDTVSVVFDTDLSNPGTCWVIRYPVVPKCVKDYEIEVYDGNCWHTVAREKENFMRKRNHSFTPKQVERIRVTAYETWGDPSARIMEIRAFQEDVNQS